MNPPFYFPPLPTPPVRSVIQKLIDALRDHATAVSEIQQLVQNNCPIMITADEVRQVITLFNTALDAQVVATGQLATVTAANAEVVTQLTAMKASIASLNDPALEADLEAVVAKATAATVPVVIPPLSAPVAFDPAKTYAPGEKALDPATSLVWTAVTPVVGEAPGVTAGNWTQDPPAPSTSPQGNPLPAGTGPAVAAPPA